MKKLSIFLLGTITGIVGCFAFAYIYATIYKYDNPYGIANIQMLENKGECITTNNLEIFQTISKGIALSHPTGNNKQSILLTDNTGKLFYDGEKIKIPQKKCAKQVGTYTYETKLGISKTVPVVIIE